MRVCCYADHQYVTLRVARKNDQKQRCSQHGRAFPARDATEATVGSHGGGSDVRQYLPAHIRTHASATTTSKQRSDSHARAREGALRWRLQLLGRGALALSDRAR